MKSFPLEIRPARTAIGPAEAWLLPGDGAQAWLRELVTWDCALERVTLLILPRSIRDRAPLAALAIGPPGTHLSSPAAIPYARLGERLFVPVHSELTTPVSGEELARLIACHTAVLHPTAGLVGFGPGDRLLVRDLLAPPPERDSDWSAARPGPPPSPRLTSIEPAKQTTLAQFLEDAGHAIGDRPPASLPPAPGERSRPLHAAWDRVQLWLARAVRFLTQRVPEGGAGPTWVDRMEAWAEARVAAVQGDLAGRRAREIDRLLDLLDKDPDEGLRFAVPVASTGEGRGTAPPGATLASREPDFDLNRVQGGRPVDGWHVAEATRSRLRARYAALANRELALGRNRRAAYILAELLGELEHAAAALKQGGHAREAAVLYRDRLKRPLLAAECLVEGGLLTEAIAIYDEAGEDERAASLYLRLERPAEAERAFRRAAEKRLRRSDVLGAARILSDRVGAPEEALALLTMEGPKTGGIQAGEILKMRFDLLGRLERHAEAEQLASKLSAGDQPELRALDLGAVLGKVAREYPTSGVRDRARDGIRVAAGRRLGLGGAEAVAGPLLQEVARSEPDDPQLGRDTQRFAERLRRPGAGRPARSSRPELSLELQLPGDVTWEVAAATGELLYACGRRRHGTVALRGRWNGAAQEVVWWAPRKSQAPLLLEPPGQAHRPTLLCMPGGAPFAPKPFPAVDWLPDPGVVGTPYWLPRSTVALAYGRGGGLWALWGTWGRGGQEAPRLSLFSPDGGLCGVYELPTRWNEVEAPFAASVHARHDGALVVVALGSRLYRLNLEEGSFEELPLPGHHAVLTGSAPYSRPRLAVSLDVGGILVSASAGFSPGTPFGIDMPAPRTVFTREGVLACLAGNECRLYRTDTGRAVHLATLEVPLESPVALVRGPHVDELVIVDAGGQALGYRVRGAEVSVKPR